MNYMKEVVKQRHAVAPYHVLSAIVNPPAPPESDCVGRAEGHGGWHIEHCFELQRFEALGGLAA